VLQCHGWAILFVSHRCWDALCYLTAPPTPNKVWDSSMHFSFIIIRQCFMWWILCHCCPCFNIHHSCLHCIILLEIQNITPDSYRRTDGSMCVHLQGQAFSEDSHARWYTGCPRRNVPDFGRVFLMLKYTDITQNTYVQSLTVTEIMAREVWNFDSCYTRIDYQIHIETGRNMWFL